MHIGPHALTVQAVAGQWTVHAVAVAQSTVVNNEVCAATSHVSPAAHATPQGSSVAHCTLHASPPMHVCWQAEPAAHWH